MIFEDEISPWSTLQTLEVNKNYSNHKNILDKTPKSKQNISINKRTFKIKNMISKIFNHTNFLIPKQINLAIKEKSKEVTPKAKKKKYKRNLKANSTNFNSRLNLTPLKNNSFLSIKPKRVILDNFSVPNFNYTPCLLTRQILDGNFDELKKALIYKF